MDRHRSSEPLGDESIKPRAHPRLIAAEGMRFIVVGGLNTLVTYALSLLLTRWMPYSIAYSIGYAVGIAQAYWLSALFVFRRPMKKRSALRFPLVYVAQFLISLAILHIAIATFQLPSWLGLAIAVGLTLPLTFILSRLIVRAE